MKKIDLSLFSILNREFYSSCSNSLKCEIIKKAKSVTLSDFKELNYSLFKRFKENGDRKEYEDIYFNKRRCLKYLVLAEAIENNGEYISLIEEGIYSILSEITWILPAHNSYIRDEEALRFPLLRNQVIDLFSAETGALLSLIREILSPVLDSVLIDNINYLLDERLLKPYLNNFFWWMGKENERMLNWSPWISQNLALSLLSYEHEYYNEVVSKLERTLKLFYNSFHQDGGCDEGPSYYLASIPCFYYALKLLKEVKEEELIVDDKLFSMSDYIRKVHLCDDLYFNFADSLPKIGALGARVYEFAKEVKNEKLMRMVSQDAKKYGFKDNMDINLYYSLLNIKLSNEILSYPSYDFHDKYTTLPSLGITIWRKDKYTLAFKGGDNGEAHNHNDLGSIVVYSGARPILIDIGVGEYTKKTFSSERYSIFTMISSYHNTLSFEQIEQEAGEEYKALVTHSSEDGLSARLEKAYKGVDKFDRTITLGDSIITIVDNVKAKSRATFNLITAEEGIIDNNRVKYSFFSFEFSSSEICQKRIDITDLKLMSAWGKAIYRLRVSFDNLLESKVII